MTVLPLACYAVLQNDLLGQRGLDQSALNRIPDNAPNVLFSYASRVLTVATIAIEILTTIAQYSIAVPV
jgi:hypothetical protein